MRIEEFIAQDLKEGILGTYRVIDTDISVGKIRVGVNISSYVVDCDIQDRLFKMGVDSYYSVLDIRNVLWATSDTKSWLKSAIAGQVVKGYAIVAGSPLSSLMADIWIKVTSLPFPVKKFSKFEDGLKWVKELKEEDLMTQEAKRA